MTPADLIPLDIFTSESVKTDVVYANADHPRNIFDTAIYRSGTRLWAHKDLATITLLMARQLNKKYGYVVEVKDCLRTTDSQAAMQETDIVKAHPRMDGRTNDAFPPWWWWPSTRHGN